MLLENVRIANVGEQREGRSASTGKQWCQRIVVLSFEDETGESYISTQVDANLWARLGYQEGDTVSLHVRFRTKNLSKGFIANDIRILDPENLGAK